LKPRGYLNSIYGEGLDNYIALLWPLESNHFQNGIPPTPSPPWSFHLLSLTQIFHLYAGSCEVEKAVSGWRLMFGQMRAQDGWSEPAATNAPIEDEPVQPVLRMNILPAHRGFFFHLLSTSKLSTSPLLPITYQPHPPLLPPPSYLPPTNPTPPHSIAGAPETSSRCGARTGVVAVEQELELGQFLDLLDQLELELEEAHAHENVQDQTKTQFVANAVQVEMQRRHFYTTHHATKLANVTAPYRTKHEIIDINMG
jgi:hypothetical protein